MIARSLTRALRSAAIAAPARVNAARAVRFAGGAAASQPAAKAKGSSIGRALGISALVIVGGGGVGAYMYSKRLRENRSVTADEFMASQQDAIRVALASRDKLLSQEIKLYGYSACPFFNKVRAFLQYNRIPFSEVEVEPLFKSEIKGVAFTKLPQLTVGDSVRLVDSDYIIDYLSPLYPEIASGPEVLVWRTWVVEELVRLVVVSINRSMLDAVAGFAYIDQFQAIPWYNKLFLKVVGAPVMYLVARNVTRPRLRKIGYTDAQLDSDASLYEQVEKWVAAVGDRPFHGGAKPDLADLAVYGVIEAMAGHPVYDRLLSETSVRPWLERLKASMPPPERPRVAQ